jgi:serine/threonine-protein kinase
VETRWIWPFELLDKLGEGGMGVVYRARYVGNDRVVAVKLVPDEVAANPTLVARFERELDVLKQLRHPHIVHCFGGVCESKQRFYAMELVDGGTLHGLLREVGKLPWETVVDYGLQMCSALQCAHEQNVVHRDVKPGNFLITKDGKLKLSDFGLAIVIASQRITSAGKTLGTFHYMAPEQIRGKPPVSNRTDLYALGCVFYEMLTGTPPFDADAAAEVLHQHLKEPPPRASEVVPDCPPELDLLIRELMQKNPEARPDSAQTVANGLKMISASPSTAKSSMALTPTVPRAVIDDGFAAAVLAEPPPRAPASRWPKVLLIASLAVCALLFADTWRARARVRNAERVFQRMFQQSSQESRLSLIGALGETESLSSRTQELLIEQLKSEDLRVRLAVVQLMLKRPHFTDAASGELSRLMREDPDPQIRNQAEAAIKAGKQNEADRARTSPLLSWTLAILFLGGLAFAAIYGWKWAKSHALIPGI